MQRLQDALLVAAMWVAGFTLISAFLAFSGAVARYVAYAFCLGYGC